MSGPAPDRVTCPRCGTVNTAGDQFCGNCGASLEAAVSPETGVSPSAPEEARPPPSTAEPAVPASGVPSSGALVRCSKCGTANTAGRAFCQRCGAKLAGAAPVARPTERIPIAPAAAATNPAAADAEATADTTAGRAARPSKARRADPVDEQSGFGSWLVLMVAGLAVGAVIVVVVLTTNSGAAPPPAAASAAPSATRAPSATLAPSAAPTPAASGGPSASADGVQSAGVAGRPFVVGNGPLAGRSYPVRLGGPR